MLTTDTEAYKDAIHLSHLIPLGKKDETKKAAVHKWYETVIVMLAKTEH